MLPHSYFVLSAVRTFSFVRWILTSQMCFSRLVRPGRAQQRESQDDERWLVGLKCTNTRKRCRKEGFRTESRCYPLDRE